MKLNKTKEKQQQLIKIKSRKKSCSKHAHFCLFSEYIQYITSCHRSMIYIYVWIFLLISSLYFFFTITYCLVLKQKQLKYNNQNRLTEFRKDGKFPG